MPTVLHTPQLIRSGVANDTGRLRPTLPHTLEAALSISGSMIDELMVGLAPACDPDRQGPLPLGLELLDESLVEQLMADADALKRDWQPPAAPGALPRAGRRRAGAAHGAL